MLNTIDAIIVNIFFYLLSYTGQTFLAERFSFFTKQNKRKYQFLDFNIDLSMDTLYFYRKRMESVIKIIQLWPEFSKVAKMVFRNFSS